MTLGVDAYGSYPVAIYPAAPTALSAGASEKVLFLTPEDSDLATLASGTAALAVANLQDIHPAKKWRSTGLTDYITVDFAGPVAANALAWLSHNHSGGGTIRVRGYETSAARTALVSPVVDTNWKTVWPLGIKPTDRNMLNPRSLIRWTNGAALQFWRIDVADTGAGLTYIEAGRLMLGVSWQPTFNLDNDGGIGITSSDVQMTSEWGGIYTDSRYAAGYMELKFSAAERVDAIRYFKELQRKRGLAKDFFVCIDPAETTDFHHYSLHGVLGTTGTFAPVNLWSESATGMLWMFGLRVNELIF